MKPLLRRSLLLALCLLPAAALAQMPAGSTYDVRNGDQTGKLMVRDVELQFESLTDAKHSRIWKFAEIRTFEKRKRKDLRVKPFKGSTYDFQINDGKLRDQIYNEITAKILAARSQGRK